MPTNESLAHGISTQEEVKWLRQQVKLREDIMQMMRDEIDSLREANKFLRRELNRKAGADGD